VLKPSEQMLMLQAQIGRAEPKLMQMVALRMRFRGRITAQATGMAEMATSRFMALPE
jgi:hypothetical protein